jgi:hypothetical protein
MAQYKKGFQGNIHIRNAGVPVEWDQHKMTEFVRCSQDPLYFVENYIYIKALDEEELILFKTRSYQKEMVNKMMNERFVIAKIPRQAGKTVIVSSILLWHLIFNRNYSVLAAAHKLDKARDIVKEVQRMFEHLPEWLQHGVVEYNKTNMILENGSRLRAAATSGSSARGDTYNLCYIDEAAFIPSHVAQHFFESVMPTISSGKTSKIFITSTPKGLNHFYMQWQAANETNPDTWSGFHPVEIRWHDVPGRDEAFKKQIIAQFGENYFSQEYAADFLGSSSTLIAGPKLATIRPTSPITETRTHHLHAQPEKGRQYAITVDVAEGLGGDSSAAIVFDITTLPYTIAMVYRDNEVLPMQLPGVIHEIARAYNNALVLVESNFGQQVADILWSDLEYEHVVRTARRKKGETISAWGGTTRPGVQMNKLTKREGCNNLKALVEKDQLLINDAWVYAELCRFAVKGQSYAAEEGHDDLAMACVLFGWMVDQGYVRDATDISIRNRIAEINAEAVENSMMPLGLITTGHEPEHELIMMNTDANRWHDPERFNKMFDPQIARRGLEIDDLRMLFQKEFMQWDKAQKR